MVLKTATAVGHTCHGDPRSETLDAAVEGLFVVATNKAEEVQFAAGEALCHVFGGAEGVHFRLQYMYVCKLFRTLQRQDGLT